MPTNATMSGAGYNATGKFGQSLNAGSGSIPISLLPANNAPWTASIWVKRATAPSAVVVALGSVGTFWMGVQATGGLAQARYGTGGTEVTVATTVNICDNAWHHLELDMDPTTGAKFYIDGVLAGSSATTMAAATPSRASVIGINIFGGGANPWGGEVDEFSLWNVVLHTADFTSQATPYIGTESNLVGLYHLDGNGTDSSGAVAATAVTLTGPTTGAVGAASSAFSVGANGVITGTVVVTPTPVAGVTFAPTSVSINTASPTATFTATASTAGAKTIAVTNDGGLTNPAPITYTASASGAGFDQTKVVFSPLNWNVSAGNAKTINPGAYFRTIFGGTACTLQFDMTGILTPLPQISYRVDGYGPWTTVDIAASVPLTIPTDTAGWANAGGRLLEVRFKSMTETQLRWATQATAVVLVGIVLDATKTLTLPTKLPRSMLFLGDSITEGDRTVKATAVPDVNSHDAFLGWAPEVARLMGFEFGVVGFSAQGAVQTGTGGVPALTGTYNFLYSGVARSFAIAPDVIVINIGTNDSTDITSAMTTVLNGLQAATPKTTRIVVLRPFNGTARSAQLQAAIAASTSPTRCLFVDTNGFFVTAKSSDSLHPYGNANLGDIAPAIVNAIQTFVAPIRGTRTARTISLPLFQDAAGTVPAADATGLVWSVYAETSPEMLTVSEDSGTAAAISGGALSLSVFTSKASGAQGYLNLSTVDGTKVFRGRVTFA
jgi:lysophospholipase L1-like esterase